MIENHSETDDPASDTAKEVLLKGQGVTKRYGGVTVLNQVDFDVRRGEILGLVGANGAGKSTLCKIISGIVAPSDGEMWVADQPYRPHRKMAAEAMGIEIVQQELSLIPSLTVAENLFLTRLPRLGGVIRRRQLRSAARRALDRLDLTEVDVDQSVASLGVGKQQMLEIASALDRDCRLLILDEPTAALSGGESERLFDWLEQRKRAGVAMIYISHRLDEITRLSDRVTIMRDGQVVETRAADQLTNDEMIEQMSGPEPVSEAMHSHHESSTSAPEESVALSVNRLCSGFVQDISFQVRRGETLGIAGLVGSGRTECLRAIFGADRAESGSVAVGEGQDQRFRHPCAAITQGMAMVTEDRKHTGLLPKESIRFNIALASLGQRLSRLGLVRQQEARRQAAEICQRMDVRCQSMEQSVDQLSGGNQQKVVVGKWLLRNPEVLLLDEPTRGIDVPARRRIYQVLRELVSEGKAVVMASSDTEELIENCDRIVVLSAGRLAAVFERHEFDLDQIMRAAFSNYQSNTAATSTQSASSTSNL